MLTAALASKYNVQTSLLSELATLIEEETKLQLHSSIVMAVIT